MPTGMDAESSAVLVESERESFRIDIDYKSGRKTMITGRCECAKVRYQVRGELKDFCHCHCTICRRFSGAAFASWGDVLRDEFSYVSGEENVRRYPFSDNSDSLFCGNCGSTLFVETKSDPHMIYLTMGAVDGDVVCPNGFHQFVGSKAPWFEITDDLPQYDGWPPEDL